jgi:hypothetical protein
VCCRATIICHPFREHIHVIFANVLLDTIRGTLKRNGLEEKDAKDDNGSTHSDIGDASSDPGTKGDAGPDDKPSQGREHCVFV